MPTKPDSAQRMRPLARLMLTIGRDLISNETVALTELVKNSFDADAGFVLVRVSGEVADGRIAAGTGCIEVLDDGVGMDSDRIADAWLVPATGFRTENHKSAAGRRILGEKGVGRFAASQLADGFSLSSRPARSDEVNVGLRWSDFDQPDRFLDEIRVAWTVRPPTVFKPSGVAGKLWKGAEEKFFRGLAGSVPTKRPTGSRGTYLKMTGLLNSWDSSTVADVRRSLARLMSPFVDQSASPFSVILDVPPELGIGGVIEAPEELNKPHYRLTADVSATGLVTGTISAKKSTARIEPFRVEDDDGEPHDEDYPLECGAFTLNLRVWDRDPTSLAPLGSSVKAVRDTLDQAAGVSVYRDGFRVLPYGEQGDDWLRLDHRRVQNPTMRLSNNQIVGYVSIGRDSNPHLVDQTNREGLVSGRALDDLRSAVRQVLAKLEEVRYGERPRSGGSRKRSGGLLQGVDLGELRDAIVHRLPKDKELVRMVVDFQKEIDVKNDEVGIALARYHRLATLGGIVDRIVHEISQPLSVVRMRANSSLGDIERIDLAKPGDEDVRLLDAVRDRLEIIQDQAVVAAGVVKRVEPFGGRQSGRPPIFEIETAIRNAVDLLRPEIDSIGALVELPTGSNEVTVDGGELQEVILNLLRNSLHWLRRVKPDADRRIRISVDRQSDGGLAITLEDSGPGVSEDVRDRIFEPYFTTRDGGYGLGLAISGEIVEDFYGGTLELLESGELGGARFRATLRKRVGA